MDNGVLLAVQIQKGYRMAKPEYSPDFIGEIMKNCWQLDPKDRPTFSQVANQIERQIESVVGFNYFNMKGLENANSLLGEIGPWLGKR